METRKCTLTWNHTLTREGTSRNGGCGGHVEKCKKISNKDFVDEKIQWSEGHLRKGGSRLDTTHFFSMVSVCLYLNLYLGGEWTHTTTCLNGFPKV